MGATYGAREWKIIGYLAAESTLKTAARVLQCKMEAFVNLTLAIVPRFFLQKDNVLPCQR